jgi:hypothetical protein
MPASKDPVTFSFNGGEVQLTSVIDPETEPPKTKKSVA